MKAETQQNAAAGKQQKTKLKLTENDEEILLLLCQGPHTIKQLQRRTCRFSQYSYEGLRRRLKELAAFDYVRSFNYYTSLAEGCLYYKVTTKGFRYVNHGVRPPSHSFFEEIADSEQKHTFATYEFVSRFDRDSFVAGYELTNFRRDRKTKLKLGSKILLSDSSFELHGHGRECLYYLETDCATERQMTTTQQSSLIQKVNFYDPFCRKLERNCRVLTVFARRPGRRDNFLKLVYDNLSPPYNRTLFLAAMLPGTKDDVNVIEDPVYRDRYGNDRALFANTYEKKTQVQMEQLVLA